MIGTRGSGSGQLSLALLPLPRLPLDSGFACRKASARHGSEVQFEFAIEQQSEEAKSKRVPVCNRLRHLSSASSIKSKAANSAADWSAIFSPPEPS